MKRIVLSAVVCMLATSMLVAQTATTSLRGTVSDPRGAVVPNANVTLQNTGQGVARTAKTDNNGSYQFVQVPPGQYTLSVSAPGFSRVSQPLNLLVNTPATINVSLSVEASSTSVEVQGEAPTLNTQDASVGNAVTQTQIAALPFEGRDPAAMLSLQPGVTFVGNNVDTGYDTRHGSVDGARSDQTNIVLDGVDNNDEGGYGTPFQGAIRTPIDSIQEFRVTTSNANADAGRSSGAQVVEVTRAGTNNFHGSLYEYNRGLVRGANDWFNKQAEAQSGEPNVPGKIVRNTFGVRVGGPIWKDRLFFFTNYEGQRTRETQQVTRIVPTQELRQGIVRYRTCPGAPGPCTGPETVVTLQPSDLASMDQGCVANGTCPWGGGPDPYVMKAWSSMPLPNQFTSGDGLNFAGYTFPAPTPGKLDTYLIRLDANLTANGNHRLFIKPQMQGDHLVPSSGAPQFPGQPPQNLNTNNSKGISIGYTAVLSNNLVNNFRFGYVRQGFAFGGTQTQPVVTFRGMDQPFAVTSTNSHIIPVKNYVDDMNWVHGAHTFQFGVNFRSVSTLLSSNGNSFLGGDTNVSWIDTAGLANKGGGLDPAVFGFPAVASDFASNYDNPVTALTGLVTEVFSNYNRDKTGATLAEGTPATRSFLAHEFETYFQDSWKLKQNLTMTLGVRYTYLQTPYETNGTEVVPDMSMDAFFKTRYADMLKGEAYAPLISYQLGGQANHGKPYWNAPKNNFAPRFALAWSPGWNNFIGRHLFGGPNKTSIRLGYGMYYDHFGEALVNSFDRFGSFGLSTQLGNPAGVQDVNNVPRFTGLNDIPQSLVIPAPAGGFPYTPPSTLDTGGFAITWGMDDKLKTPYAHVFSLGFQRELPMGFVLEGDYIGRLGRHLLEEIDMAMPEDVVDPKSGMDYFKAATLFAQAANSGVDIANMAPIPYWENLFPGAAGTSVAGGCAPGSASYAGPVTATQAMYAMYACNTGNETTALFLADVLCSPACSAIAPGGYGYFHPQFSSLYAQSSIGTSSYNGMQLILRKQSGPLQMQFNYTLSRSEDMGSNPERINEFTTFGYDSQIINAWAPKQLYAPSDWDTRHQINANVVYQLPFGKGRHFGGGAGGVLNALIGGWQLSGIWRWTSGYPFSIGPGLGYWPTDWQLTSSAVMNGTQPVTGTYVVKNDNCPQGCPNVFKDPVNAIKQFRFAYPGESGQRNNLRGPGTFDIDSGIAKLLKITERQTVELAAEAFNVTNTPRFDVGSLQYVGNNTLVNNTQFGNFNSTISKPRILQFAVRYSF